MKVEKIDHIGIMVKDLEEAIKFFADLFETEFTKIVESKELDVRSFMAPLGVEIGGSLTLDGVDAKVMESRGEGLHVLSLKVPNLEEATAEMKSRGIRLIRRYSQGSCKLAIFHPKDTYGVMIELIEYKAKHPVVAPITE